MSIRALAVLFFASGTAGLVYQVIWVRTFGRIFGNTVYSASLVTAVFMCGLGVGGYLFGRWADRMRRRGAPLKAYAYCELGIGVLAGLVAVAVELAEPLAAGLSAYRLRADGFYELSWVSIAGRYAVALVVLTPVTVLMGGTLTLLVRYLVQDDLPGSGWKIGLLYGVNTVGAAFGAFVTDAALVPGVGISGTQSVAVAINFVVALAALRWVPADPTPASRPPRCGDERGFTRRATWAGLALFLNGVIGLGLEIVWFRYISMTFGSLRSVFSTLLTVILLGLGLGSILAGVLHRRLGRPVAIYMVAQAGLVAAALGLMAAFDGPALLLAADASTASPVIFNMIPALAIAGLPSVLLGVSYPMANAAIQDAEAQVGERAGALYLANTLGAVVGSLGVGFLLIPTVGAQRTLTVMAVLAVASIGALWTVQGERRSPVAVGSLAVAAASLALWLGLPGDHLLRMGIPPALRDHRLIALSEDVDGLIAVTESPTGDRTLNTNGHPMSGTSVMSQRYMRAFSHVPLLQRDAPTDVLVMCFGVGATAHAASLHPTVETLDVVDISEHVLSHHVHFEATHHGVLEAPRTRVFINDGRQHLWMQDEGRYDLVTMEPPPIAFAGVGSLYSREFYALTRSRLKPGGFIAQWLPAYQVPQPIIRAMVGAFIDVFPASVLLSGQGRELILVGQNAQRTTFDPEQVARNLAARPAVRADLARIHLDTLTELAGTFVAGPRALRAAAQGVAPVEDDRPMTEYALTSGFFLDSVLPPELIDVKAIGQWCPTCFSARGPHPLTPRLDEYLAVQNAFYQMPLFQHAGSFVGTVDRSFDVPPDVTKQVVRDNSFLTAFFGLDPGP